MRQSVLLALVVLAACSSGPDKKAPAEVRDSAVPPAGGTLFTRMPASYTGVRFANRIKDTREMNVFTYRNFYNGGGVAIGDLNGDSLPELVLTSNHDGVRLYLNQGNFRFKDITDHSGIRSEKPWTTGVTLADVNGDGRLDIYVSKAGSGAPETRANELWINKGAGPDGTPTFEEKAHDYGIDDRGYGTQAAFLDYDRDGDLDLIVINNSPRPVSSFGSRNTRNVRDPYGGHKLYRNDGGHFTDVSAKAGIYGSEIAFGLGVAVGDVNRDGWPDIYVSNDFFERDYLYINRGNGTFVESLDREMPMVSYFSMGMDIGDLDGDGWPDVYTTDMLPEDEYRLRTMASFEGWDVYQAKIRDGYHYQFMRNMLQRNNHDGTFSDVGQMANVARTDWSWSALIADLDLDGWKDIYVTNGLARDVTSQDYVAFLANQETMKQAASGDRVDFMKLISAMSSTPLADYAFHNNGDLTFTNEAKKWGLDTPNFSNGAAYGDIDGDGSLDLVVNNVNVEAIVYRNNARELRKDAHYLQVRLEGDGLNRFAIGASVTVFSAGRTLLQEQAPTRGFQSSVDYVLSFGLGSARAVDSLLVVWPDGRRSSARNVAADQRLTIRQSTAAPAENRQPGGKIAMLKEAIAPRFVHREDDFVDFDRERLIPKMLSTEGPALAVGDVNGDGLDDVYFGGAKDQAGMLLVQKRDGSFAEASAATFERDSVSEDVGALFFDANGDGRPDLYVVSGGNEFTDLAPALQDRLYLNVGGGNFRKAEGYLPAETISGSRVAAADFDGDGDLDLFVGGRSVPWHYGRDPQSMLLRNDGTGHFTDVTDRVAPELVHVGMVTDAVWSDVDRDGRPDLIVVGEWMPVTFFHNDRGGRLTRAVLRGMENSSGWWTRIVAGDFNGDGRPDLVVGNLGLNSRLRASAAEPATLYVKDFSGDGFDDPIVACYDNSRSYPITLRDDLIKAIPALKVRYLRYEDYARASVTDIFPASQLEGAVIKDAKTFATTEFRSNRDGSYTMVPLPNDAQIAPMYGILARDLNGDGVTDLMLGGNFDGVQPEIGRLSASYGVVLRGSRDGNFTPVVSTESGFVVPGQTRDIARVRTADGEIFVVARNNDRALAFRPTHRGTR